MIAISVRHDRVVHYAPQVASDGHLRWFEVVPLPGSPPAPNVSRGFPYNGTPLEIAMNYYARQIGATRVYWEFLPKIEALMLSDMELLASAAYTRVTPQCPEEDHFAIYTNAAYAKVTP